METIENLETYNRVPVLESQKIRRILIVCYVVNIVAALACIFSYWVIDQPWPYALAGVTVSLIVGMLLINYDNHRRKTCRFCHAPLTFVIRPLVLNQDYLALEGRKVGNWFFTRRKAGLLGQDNWVKMSNQALVCRNCRLAESTNRIVGEPVSAAEIERYELTQT